MCDRKSPSTRAASAVMSVPVPTHNPNPDGYSVCSHEGDNVRERILVIEEESIFEKVKKKLRQATMIGSPARRSSVGTAAKNPSKKTRHSWHQETA